MSALYREQYRRNLPDLASICHSSFDQRNSEVIFRYNLFAPGSHHPRFALPFQSILLSSSKFFTYADIIVENLSIRQGVSAFSYVLFHIHFYAYFLRFLLFRFLIIPVKIDVTVNRITTTPVHIRISSL